MKRQIGRKASLLKWLRTTTPITKLSNFNQKINKKIAQIPFIMNRTRYSFLARYFNAKKTPVKLYWWQTKTIKNFGDMVSSDILYNLFGRRSIFSPPENCELIATGSIIDIVQQNKHNNLFIWGSGFIQPGSNTNLENMTFAAVRGKRTKQRVGNNKVTLGDPGILINSVYAIKRKKRSNKIGVVIHYADMKTPYAKKFCEDNRFEVITPLDDPEVVARKISQCGLILSSSLHGLIFADSLSIPNFHIKLSNNLVGKTYKFFDYYSGINKKYYPANIEKIFDDNYLQQLKKHYQPIPELTKKQRALIKAFPF